MTDDRPKPYTPEDSARDRVAKTMAKFNAMPFNDMLREVFRRGADAAISAYLDKPGGEQMDASQREVIAQIKADRHKGEDAEVLSALADLARVCVEVRAALDRIRLAVKTNHPGACGIDTVAGLAASVDTFIEAGAAAEKRLLWAETQLRRIAESAGVDGWEVCPTNTVGVDRLIERVRGRITAVSESEKQPTISDKGGARG